MITARIGALAGVGGNYGRTTVAPVIRSSWP